MATPDLKPLPEAQRMVREQIAARGITDARVLDIMERIPRTAFVPTALRGRAYEDSPLPIGDGQTISQPYMVGLMTELLHLHPASHVLEIGTGSGYQTAILAALAGHVVSIERHAALAQRADTALRTLGFTNIEIHAADGTRGWPERAPYDAILVTAGAPMLPEPLLTQLAEDARMVCPVGPRDLQDLMLTTRKNNHYQHQTHTRCIFVPLVGQEGWPEP